MKIEKIFFDQTQKDFVAELADTDKTYSMTMCDFEESEIKKASVLADQICSWLESNESVARDFCAAKLLDLKNETWLEEGEEPLSQDKFRNTIALCSIIAFGDGSFTLYFDDNDIFWGHSIAVEIDENLVLQDAELAG